MNRPNVTLNDFPRLNATGEAAVIAWVHAVGRWCSVEDCLEAACDVGLQAGSYQVGIELLPASTRTRRREVLLLDESWFYRHDKLPC